VSKQLEISGVVLSSMDLVSYLVAVAMCFSVQLHDDCSCNAILFATCTSTFSKLCKNLYGEECSVALTPLELKVSRPVVAFGYED
jgi:hypothetical protein